MTASIWKNKTFAVIGGGNMAEALLRGVLSSGLIPPAGIAVYDPLPARREVFASLGCRTAESGPGAAGDADVILLATKPQVVDAALAELAPAFRPGTLLVSIAAGVATARLEKSLPPAARVVRVMPNTPLLVGMGTAAVCRGRAAGDGDAALALALFGSCGTAVEVAENLMDAVTALSGSGPAYLFRFAEELIAGGEKLGLPPALARELTVGTLRGAAEMLSRGGNAAELRERVTSPGGTTAAALAVFDERGLAAIVTDALEAARRRGEELGRGR